MTSTIKNGKRKQRTMNDTSLFSHDESLCLKEQYAEHLALLVVGSVSFTDCLRRFGLPTALEIALPTRGSIHIEGGGLRNQRTWKKFLSTTGQDEHIHQLTGAGELLAKHYTAWLLSQHTRRYRLIQ